MTTKSQLIAAVTQQASPSTDATLDSSVAAKLVASFAESITTARNSGSALAGFCAAAHGAGLPANPAKSIVEQLITGIAEKMEWAGTARERVNKAEARAIISAHALLPEAVTAYRTATGACNYHDAVKLARNVNESGSVDMAVAKMTAKVESKKDPVASITRAVQAFYKHLQNKQPKKDAGKAERLAHMDACKAFAIAAGLKLKTE